jgi:hypothetical protein
VTKRKVKQDLEMAMFQQATHYHDIFYDIMALKPFKRIELIQDAKRIAMKWRLDCLKPGHMQREALEKATWRDVLEKIGHGTLFTFIFRRGFTSGYSIPWHLEVGYRTMTSPDWILWIDVHSCYLEDFVKKYKLELL